MSSRGIWAFLWGVLAFLVLMPDLVGFDKWTPFAQLVAFRPVLAFVVLLAGVLAVFPRVSRPSGYVLVVVALVAVGLFVPRLWRLQMPASGGAALGVLTVNVQEGELTPVAVARLIRHYDADLVSLPEATDSYRASLEARLDDLYAGYSEQGASAANALSALYKRELDLEGAVYHSTSTPTWVLSGKALGDVQFVAFSAHAPLPGRTDRWRSDLTFLHPWCAGHRSTIIAGDFNATLDHGVFRRATQGCEDAARQQGRGLAATWPAKLPPWLGTQLDHIVYTGNVQPQEVTFPEMFGSEHRAVFARLGVGGPLES